MAESDKEKILEYIKNNEDKLDYDGVFGEVMDTSEHSVDLTKRRALDIYSPTQLHTSKAMNKDELLIYELFKQCKSFKNQRDELINDMEETKKKAEAFDGINKLKDNIKFIKDVSLSHANEEPVNQEMYWVHLLMDSLLEELEANHEG